MALGLALSALIGCAGRPADRPLAADLARYANPAYHVALTYPARLQTAARFADDYVLTPRWNPDAPPSVPGRPLLSLRLPESNHLLDARLRLGASRDPAATADCAEPPAANTPPGFAAPRRVSIAGVAFRRIASGDAGMGHFLRRRSYRGVDGNVCHAVDLVVSGVAPGMYPDQPTPPMSVAAAFERLTALLGGLSFSNKMGARP